MALNGARAFKRAVARNVRRAKTLDFGSGNGAASAVSAAKRRDLRVFVWTVDSREEMEWLVGSGVDGVITNRPGMLGDIVERRRKS